MCCIAFAENRDGIYKTELRNIMMILGYQTIILLFFLLYLQLWLYRKLNTLLFSIHITQRAVGHNVITIFNNFL